MEKISLDTYIEILYQKAKLNFEEFIKMKFAQIKSKELVGEKGEILKVIDEKLIEDYLKKRGYSMNYILGKRVMIKDFICVFCANNHIEVWHDKVPNNKSVFIHQSILTGLPITLTYMERI